MTKSEAYQLAKKRGFKKSKATFGINFKKTPDAVICGIKRTESGNYEDVLSSTLQDLNSLESPNGNNGKITLDQLSLNNSFVAEEESQEKNEKLTQEVIDSHTVLDGAENNPSLSSNKQDQNYPSSTSVVASSQLPDIVEGTLLLCRLYEIADEIDLGGVSNCIAKPTARRQISVHAKQAESIQIAQPPVQAEFGKISFSVGGVFLTGTLRTSIYELGAIALTLELPLLEITRWSTIAHIIGALQESPQELQTLFLTALEELEKLLAPVLKKPHRGSIVEDYSIVVIEHLAQEIDIPELANNPYVWATVLGEKRVLSQNASKLLTQMSYYSNDLALLSWNTALLIEPDPLAVATAVALIEFANVELLLMRSYDAELDAELPLLYRQLPQERPQFAIPLVGRYSRLLHQVQRLVAEFTEVTERVDNALKVTDDVYWNRFYSALLNVLRVDVWRSGVEHKLALLRETYGMLHNEADTERATALEWIIVLLIFFEIVMALLRNT
ncbi:hypothetical protein PCC7424_0833 [Gloeothece citriformis PCC 7424]|uniref:DUF155 domain-containing protein n=1 Tax=Gloeothece citriformis (strain PCC 7424) TaxID=65393 RepID=B7KH80_GLOC7|nr:hypothetical protein [Gloeothece citriformis]ACK69289.1 hypothetical protein PCC7424_0833 [Gloeothece citriformis PCC 7424]